MKIIKFLPNRVLRLYSGGSGIDRLCGNPNPVDRKFPENWIASCIEGNGRVYHSPGHGISRLIYEGEEFSFPDFLHQHAEEILGSAHLKRFGETPAVLTKILDSAVLLPLQVHPTRAQAKKYFHVPYGKTEAWVVIGTRTVNGEEPYLLTGFNESFDHDTFYKESLEGKYSASYHMLHKITVKPGDVILIRGGLPHAIGPGVTMIEIMEPSDLVIVPEVNCFGTLLNKKQRFAALDPKIAMSFFNEVVYSRQEQLKKISPMPELCEKKDNGMLKKLIPENACGFFEVRELTFNGKWPLKLDGRCQIGVCVEGNFMVGETSFAPGDCFLIPVSMPPFEFVGKTKMILVLPPACTIDKCSH
ncbi:MAG: hypothetical protein WCS73_08640 [Lentisphaeria bacterium]